MTVLHITIGNTANCRENKHAINALDDADHDRDKRKNLRLIGHCWKVAAS